MIYLQDRVVNAEFEVIQGGDIKLRPNDIISIIVSSKDPELVLIFNLPKSQLYAANYSKAGITGTQGEILGYTVDASGCIDFPVLGKVKVEGMISLEVAAKIKSMLIEQGLVKDPIVTVEFVNLQVSILGDVASPGRYSLTRNNTTIFDALSMAGDLNVTGVRDRVFLTRKMENNNLITYQLDLKSNDIYQSPAFFVQQDDMIYVEPNRMKTNQSTANANTFSTSSFWISIASLLTTIMVIIIN
ncbi:MAG: polysaccharide biosynthesis/export family protein [Bacteroidales bacterium]